MLGKLLLPHPLHCVREEFFECRVRVRLVVVTQGDADNTGFRVLHHPDAWDGVFCFVRSIVAADVYVVSGLKLEPVVLVGDLEGFRNGLGDVMSFVAYGDFK